MTTPVPLSARLAALLTLVLTLAAAACAQPLPTTPPAPPAKKPVIVCTVSMITSVVAEIAGDRCEVTGLIGAGIDPHLFKPTRADVARLLSADAVFFNGLHLEGKLIEALERVGKNGKPVVAVTRDVPPASLHHPGGTGEHPDPHVWMDPTLWASTAGVIAETLASIDPAGKDGFTRRAEAFKARADTLHAYAQKVLNTVPKDARVLVTAHDAFGYFGSRYGFEVVGLQGISTESEAGVRDVERIVSMLVDRKIRAVFVESTIPPRTVRALVEGAGAKGHAVTIGGELFSDAAGAAGTYEGTYIGMIDHNVTTIARALGGEAPSGGLDGRLSSPFMDREKPDPAEAPK